RLQRLRRRTDQRGFRVVGCIRTNEETVCVDAGKVLEKTPEQSLLDFTKQNGIDEIVIAMDERRSGLPLEQLLACRLHGISVIDLVDFLERETGKLDVELVNPSYMILGPGFRQSPLRSLSARALDVVGSFLLLSLCLPIMAIAVLAILLEDGRPI